MADNLARKQDQALDESVMFFETVAGSMEAYIEMTNIASKIPQDDLDKIGAEVLRGFKIDDESRNEWKVLYREWLKLARLVMETKSFPWANASNVKFPLLTVAAIQFSSRAFKTLFKNKYDIVKGKPIGKDDKEQSKQKRSDRIGAHMSYQLNDEVPNWIMDMDKLLTILPVVGCLFKKTYFSPADQANISDLIMPIDLVVHYKTKSLERASRITHRYFLTPNEIEERIRANVFVKDFKPGQAQVSTKEDEDSEAPPDLGTDLDRPHEFLEQHTWWDLDGDGYKEPYIITIHKQSRKVVRITARFDIDGIIMKEGKVQKIKPVIYFTKYYFMPSMDGSFYDVGFGHLLYPINSAINSAINQLIDAATDQNAGGGWISGHTQLGRGKGGGEVRFEPGEWKVLNITPEQLKNAAVPRITSQPSQALFQLLSLMIDAGKEIGYNDLMVGEVPSADVPATTTMAMLEQGLQVYATIYERLFNSLSSEYKKFYRLNRIYMNQEHYYRILDEPQAIKRIDYERQDADVVPVADPSDIANTVKLVKGRALLELKGQGLNDKEIMRRYLEALGETDIDVILDVPPPPPAPEVEMMKMQFEAQKEANRVKLIEVTMKYSDMIEKKMKLQAEVVKLLAEAESIEKGDQLDEYMANVNALKEAITLQETITDKVGGLLNEAGQQTAGLAPGAPGDGGVPSGMEAQ